MFRAFSVCRCVSVSLLCCTLVFATKHCSRVPQSYISWYFPSFMKIIILLLFRTKQLQQHCYLHWKVYEWRYNMWINVLLICMRVSQSVSTRLSFLYSKIWILKTCMNIMKKNFFTCIVSYELWRILKQTPFGKGTS